MTRHRLSTATSVLVAGLFAATTLAVATPAPTHAEPNSACTQQYLFVHDMAGTAAEMSRFATRVGTASRCSVVADYGHTPLTDAVVAAGGPPVAGFTAVDESAERLAALMHREQRAESDGWTVIAHGAGALAAQRVVQTRQIGATIDELVAIGPIWRGTNIGFLGDTEDISRRLGTYDAVLAVEKPLIDPWCAGCRELVRGSDLLVALRQSGLPTPGVRYTNIVSPVDGLVSEPMSAALPGMDTRILDPARPHGPADHFALLSEPAVADWVRNVVWAVAAS